MTGEPAGAFYQKEISPNGPEVRLGGVHRFTGSVQTNVLVFRFKDNFALDSANRTVASQPSGMGAPVALSVSSNHQLFELICRGFFASVTRLWTVLDGRRLDAPHRNAC